MEKPSPVILLTLELITKLSEIGKQYIMELAIDKPGMYLAEIQQELFQATAIDVSEVELYKRMNSQDRK